MRQTLLLIACIGATLSAEQGADQRSVSAWLGGGDVMPTIARNQSFPSLAAVPPATRGTLQVEAVVGTAGRVVHGRVLFSPDGTGALERAVVTALQSWTFRPATESGRPVASLVRLDVDVEPSTAAGGS